MYQIIKVMPPINFIATHLYNSFETIKTTTQGKSLSVGVLHPFQNINTKTEFQVFSILQTLKSLIKEVRKLTKNITR